MKFKLTSYEKKNYVMKDRKDFLILSKIKQLENTKIDRKDREIIRLIKTQLKNDWRTPLIVYLNKLLIKYRR